MSSSGRSSTLALFQSTRFCHVAGYGGTHNAKVGPSGTQADQTDGSVPPRAQHDRDVRCGMMEDDTDDEDTDEEDPIEDEIVDLTGD
ncbi:hypothetical protein C2S52_012197 [Perilla frutescens var. hirtella]|nr:hypothetical protein C2S52_012197 [Perilla frutescens var. hirtella]